MPRAKQSMDGNTAAAARSNMRKQMLQQSILIHHPAPMVRDSV